MTFETRLTESTQAERAAMIAAGMAEISFSELLERLGLYGYRIADDMCLAYVNSGNARTYRARSISYADVETGLSFSHYQGRRDSRFNQLQDMRGGCFVFRAGYIWEL